MVADHPSKLVSHGSTPCTGTFPFGQLHSFPPLRSKLPCVSCATQNAPRVHKTLSDNLDAEQQGGTPTPCDLTVAADYYLQSICIMVR